jgi:RNA-directed DNA polymerase
MIEILERKIDDKRLITLVKMMLKAGYMEEWKYHSTYSGTPQGGVISPLLANIYLHELDTYMEDMIKSFNKGNVRRANREYWKLQDKRSSIGRSIKRQKENNPEDKERLQMLYQEENVIKAEMRKVPSIDPYDMDYRRLRYIRYADDFIVGIIGPKEDAEAVLEKVKRYVYDELKLELAEDKTCIKHAEKGVNFLGYEVRSYSDHGYVTRFRRKGKLTLKRSITGQMQLHVPREKKEKFCEKHRYGKYDGKSVRAKSRPELLERSDIEILLTYNAEMRGIANYYVLATGYKTHLSKLIAKAQFSFFATMAHKHKTNTPKIMQRLRLPNNGGHGITVEVKGKPKTYVLFKLANHKKPDVANTVVDAIPATMQYTLTRTEIIQRLNANQCEYCGKDGGYMEVHHIRAMKDVDNGKEGWERMMSAMRRKTLVLCRSCHHELHGKGLPDWRMLTKPK